MGKLPIARPRDAAGLPTETEGRRCDVISAHYFCRVPAVVYGVRQTKWRLKTAAGLRDCLPARMMFVTRLGSTSKHGSEDWRFA